MTCPSLETVAAWVLDELPTAESEQFEEHYFGCQACFQRAQAMQQLVSHLRTALPPVLTEARRQRLEAEAPLPRVHVQPGETRQIRLSAAQPLGIWVMHSALEGVSRVDLEARTATDGVLFSLLDVPFDAARGEVLLPCQLQYQAITRDMILHVQLSTPEPAGRRTLGEYLLDHVYENP